MTLNSKLAATVAATLAMTSGLACAQTSKPCVIAFFLPENTTPRYEGRDRPYFESEVKRQAPDCRVLYFNAANDGTTQQQQADTALTQGASVLVLDPADTAAATTIVEKALVKGIKTISYDRTANGPVAYKVGFDTPQVGVLQAQSLVDAMRKTGAGPGASVIMINGDISGLEARRFKAGAHSVLDPSGFKIAAEYDTPKWSPDTAATQMTQAITAVGKSNIAGVYVANDTMAGAAINAMQRAGIKPLPPVTGQDASVDALQRVLMGTQHMTVYKALKQLGAQAATVAIAVAKGQPVPTMTSTITSGSNNVIPAIQLVPIVVTAENVKATVVADGFVDVAVLCAGEVRAACDKHGIK